MLALATCQQLYCSCLPSKAKLCYSCAAMLGLLIVNGRVQGDLAGAPHVSLALGTVVDYYAG